jgi:hypothetical protein
MRTLYRVYVDEAGDRGWGGRSSDVFVLAAVVLQDSVDRDARTRLAKINEAFGRSPHAGLHWADNIREHAQRKFVAREVAATDCVLLAVVVHKTCLIGTGTGMSDSTQQYNYAVRRLLERISWLMQKSDGEAIVTFAHVRRFPYSRLHEYVKLLMDLPSNIHWDRFHGPFRIEQPERIRLLQMADIVAGCLYAALRTDRFGDYEAAYALQLAPRFWTGPTGKLATYGLHFIGTNECGCPSNYPWWPTMQRAAR